MELMNCCKAWSSSWSVGGIPRTLLLPPDILDPDEDVCFLAPPCIRESQDVLQEFRFFLISGTNETILFFLKVDRRAFLLEEQTFKHLAGHRSATSSRIRSLIPPPSLLSSASPTSASYVVSRLLAVQVRSSASCAFFTGGNVGVAATMAFLGGRRHRFAGVAGLPRASIAGFNLSRSAMRRATIWSTAMAHSFAHRTWSSAALDANYLLFSVEMILVRVFSLT